MICICADITLNTIKLGWVTSSNCNDDRAFLCQQLRASIARLSATLMATITMTRATSINASKPGILKSTP